MSRLSSLPGRAKAPVGVLLLALAVGAAACDEDGKTTPERCADPVLPIYDIQSAGVPADDNAQYPCVTQVGHSISSTGTEDTGGTSTTGGATTGGRGGATTGGKGGSTSGSGGAGGAADAGAGGA